MIDAAKIVEIQRQKAEEEAAAAEAGQDASAEPTRTHPLKGVVQKYPLEGK